MSPAPTADPVGKHGGINGSEGGAAGDRVAIRRLSPDGGTYAESISQAVSTVRPGDADESGLTALLS